MEGKIAVLGDADFVMPFSALGLDTYAVGEGVESVLAKARTIVGAEYVLVVVAENIAPAAEQAFAAERNKAVPCMVIVPFTTASEGVATQALGTILKMATGINILQDA